MNPLLFFFELLVNFILWPIYFVVVCVGYVYDLFACKKVPTPRKIVVTGASSGMGACCAIEYAETGVTLVLMGRNAERLAATKKACEDKGASVVTFECDLREKEKVEAFLKEEDDKAPVDLIIAAAGVMIPQCGKNQDIDETTRELYSINIYGTMNTILPLLSRMQQRRSGQIAIFSSGAGFCAEPMNPIYSATKVALTAYGESLRYIMRDYNVFVSVVDPGAVRTPMTLVPYLRDMESSLASPEGMAKTLRAGLKRDFMHIGYTTAQHWAIVTLLGDMPYTAKDYILRALIPVFKASKQYLIEFHPPTENYGCLLKTGEISQSLRMPPPLFPFLLPGAVYCVPLIMFRLFCRMEVAFDFRLFLRFSCSFRCCFCASIIFFVSFFWWMASRFRLRIPGIDDL